MLRIYLNGKFTVQRTTGVQRVALNLVKALDADLSVDASNLVLVCPPNGTPPKLRRIRISHVGASIVPLVVWEQVLLPRSAADGLLVNLAGASPLLARRQACLIHDAAVFDHPAAYRWQFVAWYRLLFRHLANSGATLLTVSNFSRERLALHLKVELARIGVVPNGGDHLEEVEADDGVLARHGLRNVDYLLAVGSANPTKNLDALVAAYRCLPVDKAPCLVIVGGSNERIFAGSATVDPAGVHRLGSVGDAALKSLYRHALGLIFPSVYEGFGLPPLEAMACGCAVAASRMAAMPEVCGNAALYFDPNQKDDMARAMQSLWLDAALREKLRQAGRLRVRQMRWSDSATTLWSALKRAAVSTASR